MMLTLSFFAGALWGLANAWCLTRAVRCVVEGKQGWKLAGWVAAKLVGLYGLAACMLIGLRLPAVPWLAGFTLSLVLLVLKMNPRVARND
jgi:hypothetical protein